MSSAVAVAQFAPGADTSTNVATIDRLAREAVERGAGLVVFPEYSSYFDGAPAEQWLPHAEGLDGPFISALGALADELGAIVVAGMVERADDPRKVRNTLVALAPGTGLVATYRKLHLYDAFGVLESDWVEAGVIEAPETFAWGGFTVGLQTCYDIRFPEVTRRVVDAGADLVLVPAEWVRGPLKEHHWRTLVTTRAIENTIYVAAAGQTPPIGVGNSLIVDPMGVAIASLGEAEDVAVATISPDRLAEVRRVNPALALRRFGIAPSD